MAVAVIVAVLEPGNSGPKLDGLADKTTSAIVAEAELLKMVPLWIVAGIEPIVPTRFTQVLAMLPFVQPV
jgi:hypothetical protein